MYVFPDREVVVHIILVARGSGLGANRLPVVHLLNSGSYVTVLINSRIVRTNYLPHPNNIAVLILLLAFLPIHILCFARRIIPFLHY